MQNNITYWDDLNNISYKIFVLEQYDVRVLATP